MKYTLYMCIVTALFAFGLSGCGDEKNSSAPGQVRIAPATNATNATEAAPATNSTDDAGGGAATNATDAAPTGTAPATNATAPAPAANATEAGAATDGDASILGEEDLRHRHFFLKSVNGKGYAQTERRPELSFTDNFRLAGAFCNRIMGQASLEDGVLTAGPLASTRMHCPEEALNKLEQAFLLNLEKGVKLSLKGPLLTLKGEDMELVFEEQASAQ